MTKAHKEAGHAEKPQRARPAPTSRLRPVLLLLGLYAVLLVAGHWLGVRVEALFDIETVPWAHRAKDLAVLGALFAYVVMTALPFVPGAEIGLALIMVFGAKIVGVVYLATVLSLLLAFGLGRLVPEARLAALFGRLGLERTSRLLHDFSGLDASDRVQRLAERAPTRWVPWLLRHRFLALVVLLNMPGNTILGGGGGIAMLTGMSRMMSVPLFLATVLPAVAPIPAGVLLASWAGR
ncbi:MAG: hypothetical protein R3E44_06060 [Paracoccaceae bacterium]